MELVLDLENKVVGWWESRISIERNYQGKVKNLKSNKLGGKIGEGVLNQLEKSGDKKSLNSKI